MEQHIADYKAAIASAQAMIALAEMYAEDCANASAARCYREAADFLDAAALARENAFKAGSTAA